MLCERGELVSTNEQEAVKVAVKAVVIHVDGTLLVKKLWLDMASGHRCVCPSPGGDLHTVAAATRGRDAMRC